MVEQIIVDYFIEFGVDRLMHSDWLLAAVILVVMLIKRSVGNAKRKK